MADTSPIQVDHGPTLKQWYIAEYAQHERTRGWFIVAGFTTFLLFLLSMWTPNWFFDRPNFLFAIFILLTIITVMVRHWEQPAHLTVAIYGDGVQVGEKFFAYQDLGSFWIIYEPPQVKMLYFHFRTLWRPRLPIPLEEENPLEVRELLSQYLVEDLTREGEPTSDTFGRVLKL